MADRHPAVRIVTDQLTRLKMERDNARAIARILAHSYATDNRPPKGMAEEALKFPVLPQKEPLTGRIVAVIKAAELVREDWWLTGDVPVIACEPDVAQGLRDALDALDGEP